jgi:hypothetical protein
MASSSRSIVRCAVLTAATLLPHAAYCQPQAAAPAKVRAAAVELACAPTAAEASPSLAVTVAGSPVDGRRLFGAGDTVFIHAAANQVVRAGEDYFVRRVVSDPYGPRRRDSLKRRSIHTAGWIHIAEVHGAASVATVTHACDAVMSGDYLEPFVLPEVPQPAATGQVDFVAPGRVLFADDWRELGGPGSFMVLDRGAAHGLTSGQHVTIFRAAAGGSVARVGEATAMLVGQETATIRIDRSSDVIYAGDLAAINR